MASIRSLQFIFLGTGTSGGVPVIACDCDACTSTDPRDTRTRQGACVTWIDKEGKERVVLIDATPDLRQQALRHDIRRCDAILFTHNHVDHIFGLDEVRRWCVVMGRELGIGPIPIDIYAERHTMDALRRVYRHIFDAQSNVNKSFVASLLPRLLEPEDPVELHGMRFTPIRLMHGKLPIVGFRIEPVDPKHLSAAGGGAFPIAYCTDVSGIPPETWVYLEGLGTLVLDGLRIRHHPTHFNVDQAVGVAERVGAGRTYLVHLAHEIVHAEVEAGLPEGVRLAYDGLVVG